MIFLSSKYMYDKGIDLNFLLLLAHLDFIKT